MSDTSHTARDAALFVLRKLSDAGHAALFAGGCVRDMLMERDPRDYDIATDAAPERVGELFPRANHVGAKFGVMLVRKFGYEIEVATFRSDGDYTDGRHPDQVHFGTDREDALRRDFTINGLFLDPTTDTVIDYVGGREDLDAGIVRTIGDPMQRFAEDHLRMLRAVRFAARFSFEIAPPTRDAIRLAAPHLRRISPERIWMELDQILIDPSRAIGWALIDSLALGDYLAEGWHPESERHGIIVTRLANLGDQQIESCLGMAAVVADESPDAAGRICRTLRQSNRDVQAVVWLVRSLPRARASTALDLADLKALMASRHWPALKALFRAELIATGEAPKAYDALVERSDRVSPEQVAPPPLITGEMLVQIGLKPGPALGAILNEIYRAQRNEKVRTQEEAMDLAKRLIAPTS